MLINVCSNMWAHPPPVPPASTFAFTKSGLTSRSHDSSHAHPSNLRVGFGVLKLLSPRLPPTTHPGTREQALRCRDPSLAWCLEDCARWDRADRLTREGERLTFASDYGKAVELFTQVLLVLLSSMLPSCVCRVCVPLLPLSRRSPGNGHARRCRWRPRNTRECRQVIALVSE